jgi:anti-anti-sigma factor
MNIQTRITDAFFEAKLSDRLSFADNAAFRKLIDDMKTSKAPRWVIDVSGLSSVDSAGLGMFIIAHEAAKKVGFHMVLRAPGGHVRNLIELSKMDKLINIED